MPSSRRRFRRRNLKGRKEDFERRRSAIDQQYEEQRQNRQRSSTSDTAAETQPKDSDSTKTKDDSHSEERINYKSSSRSTEPSQGGRTKTTKSPSSWNGDIDSRRYKSQRGHSSGDDTDEDHSFPDISHRRNKKFSRNSNRADDDFGSPAGWKKTNFSDQDDDLDLATSKPHGHNKLSSSERNSLDTGYRKNCNKDNDRLTPDRTYGRKKNSSPFYKSPSSSDHNPKYYNRRDKLRGDENDHASSACSNKASSPSLKKPREIGGEKKSRFNGNTTGLEKVSSSSQSRTMQREDPGPINAAGNDSDSDASFDLLSIKRKRENENIMNRVSNQDTLEVKRQGKPHTSPTNNPRRSRSSSFSEAKVEDLEEDNTFQLEKKLSRKRTDDDNSEYRSDRKPKRRRESSSLRRKKTPPSGTPSDRFDDEESVPESDDDSNQTKPPSRKDRNRKSRNSVTSKYETEDQSSCASMEVEASAKSAPTSFANDDDDGFMSDCVPSPEKSDKKKANSRNRREKASPDYQTERSPRSPTDGETERSRKKKGRKERNSESVFGFDDDDGETTHEGSVDDLHPFFENPKFGPSEPMEPLVLSNDENDSPVQVPASLSRYLAPFQKEGIRFVYDCLARNSGVILGDEMGCGKTVQVISLLCALFQKTGTRKDFIDIRDRNSLVRKKIMKVRKQRDQAFKMGEIFDEDIEEWKSSLSLSSWNPVMIIVPPTIVDTWKNAFKTFSHFSVSFYSSQTKDSAINSMIYGSADILVVPKSSFQEERHLHELQKVNWKLVVIDEFHNFKNQKAKISKHLRQLKQLHDPLVLGMTGTLMQNNHKELWNLVDLVETNYFGSQDHFRMNIEKPITLGRHKCADPRAKAKSEAAKAELTKKLSKIYIKRSKKDVLKLPEKKEEFILCDLSDLQKEVYKHIVELPDFDLVKHGSRPCDCGINQNFFRKLFKLTDKAEQLEYMRENKAAIVNQAKCCKRLPINPMQHGDEGEPRIDQDAAIWRTLDSHCISVEAANYGCERCPWCCTLPCLTKLKKLSSHLGLLQAQKTKEAKGSEAYIKYMKEREFAKVALAGVVHQLPGRDYDRNNGIMDDHFNLSGKLKVLNNLLQKDFDERKKVLLFSHSTQSLDLIENWVRSRGSFEYLRMDGSTPSSKRQELTDQFNKTDHIFLFLLSMKATGLGLNLTSANRVIMFDLSWNPSWEIQAQDRAHRIGQTRDVHVVRLISKGTVEEMVYLRQIYKEHLKQDTLEEEDDGAAPRVFRGIQGDKYNKGELFGTENLFRFKEKGSFLQDIYNMRPGSRGRGDRNSSGFDIHDSRKVSEVLLGMSDEEKKKIGEADEVVAMKSLSAKTDESGSQDSSGETGPRESKPTDENPQADESMQTDFDARNYRDLFRSDRGGAAIEEGEEGFDEEMGGQTQAAYEIYENLKDNLGEEEGNSDGPSDDNKKEDGIGDTGNEESTNERNHGKVTLQVKQEIPDTIESLGPSHLTNIMMPTMNTTDQAMPDPIPSNAFISTNDKSSSLGGHIQCKSEEVPERKLQHKSQADSQAPTDGGNYSKTLDRQNVQYKSEDAPESESAIDVASSNDGNERSQVSDREIDVAKEMCENNSKRRTQRPKKIQLMGCNVTDQNTEFTIKRPNYKKKKRNKKKKKTSESK